MFLERVQKYIKSTQTHTRVKQKQLDKIKTPGEEKPKIRTK